ncbi:uncharacterized protein LOC106663493 [Cimex lectularius]|uniref:Uncharacterized protein n=1 Tax=Cimex lectularius TaxID=79782 RepID=A0A8I6REM9_CIMLE|nr:uncharacterized protein LOC106663493 [Cimex lectularius]XP_014243850.1 uncharacterized protein LOC106663493 [Cimex lectularius]XP_014243852.1 uncharacterized protein LOC106663493 [Cimex lectularius]
MWRWEFWVGALLCTASCALCSLESPELALLLANESPPVAAKRITPKSVFVAPSFSQPSCAEGYRQDALGRCVRIVRINEAAQLDFFLQRLNSMHAPPVRQTIMHNAGPLRLPIPLGTTTMGPMTTSTEATMTTAATTTITTTTLSEEEEIPTSTFPSTTASQDIEETETPLLIIVANTTEPTSTSSDAMSTVTNMAYTEPTITTESPETTTVPLPPSTYFPMRYVPVRFPERPTIVRFPSGVHVSVSNPSWWPHSWEQWPSVRKRGHREPRPSWINQ